MLLFFKHRSMEVVKVLRTLVAVLQATMEGSTLHTYAN